MTPKTNCVYVVEFHNPPTPGFVGHTCTIKEPTPAYRMVARHGAFRSPEIASDWARTASAGRDFEIIKLEILTIGQVGLDESGKRR